MEQDTRLVLDHLGKLFNSSTPPEIPEALADDPEMKQLHEQILVIRSTVAAFARGDMSLDITTRGSLAGGLKTLQAHLRHLVWQVQQVEMADYSQRVSFMGEFSSAFNKMVERLDSTRKELHRKEIALLKLNKTLQREIELRTAAMLALKKNEAKLKHLAGHDPLTGIINRRLFMDKARRLLRNCMRRSIPCSVVMLDVDHFKGFNDTYGHQAGDAALCHVADTIRLGLRERDLVGRYGGEEFIFCFGGTDLEQAAGLAERIRGTLEKEPVLWEQTALRLTASFGVSVALPEVHVSTDLLTQMIKEADANLYAAKAEGRNRVVASTITPGQEAGDASADYRSDRRTQKISQSA